jgi:peptide/nickel transport system substrate-binding protein
LTKGGTPVTLRITSSQGNALRQSEEAVITNDLQAIGIKVTEVDTASLGKTGASGDFDMFLFGWVLSPFPSGNDAIYESAAKGGANSENFDKINDPKVDALITKADNDLDATQQAADYNSADTELWAQMYTLPLFQKPTLLVYNTKFVNMFNDPTLEGPTFNEQLWGVKA